MKTAETLKERCLGEALNLIAENGIERLSLRDVARRLSVSHQAPYKHFSSRDHLLAVASGRAYQALGSAIKSRPVSPDPATDLYEIGRAYLEFARQNPVHYRLLFAMDQAELESYPDSHAQVAIAKDELKEAIRRLTQVQDTGFIEQASHFAWAAVHGLASLNVHCSAQLDSQQEAASLSYICSAIEAQAVSFATRRE